MTFEFQIQILYMYHISNGNRVYTDSVYKINPMHYISNFDNVYKLNLFNLIYVAKKTEQL